MKATKITWVTCVGVYGEPPLDHGNCFDVVADDGKSYHIVNFNHENLEALQAKGLTLPLEMRQLGDSKAAIIMDPRIGERWYQHRYCEVCCPRDLLPSSQRAIHERDIARGRRTESKHWISFDMTKKVEFE